MHHSNSLWDYIKDTFNWLFGRDCVKHGKIDLLCGEYEISLPIKNSCCNPIKFWIRLEECGHPVCHGDESFNWISYRIFQNEIILKAKIKTQKAKIHWAMMS